MARYTRTPVSTLQGINNELAKVELAMQDTLDRKGVTPNFMDANLDMNSRRILNLPAPLTDQEPLRKGDIPTGLSVSSQYVDDKFLTVQSFIDNFALKIFQSPTDGGLTKIQTRTVDAGEVYEVRKTSDDSLATIYSNAGTVEIAQNGTDNKSGSDGVIEFYIADGDYYVESNAVKSNFTSLVKATNVETSDGRNVQERLDDLPSEVDAAGTATTLIQEHNSNAGAHPELSSFITSEADRAAASADNAALNDNIYTNTTEGLSSGKAFFSIVSPSNTGYLDLYQNVSGSAAYRKTYPNNNRVAELETTATKAEEKITSVTENTLQLFNYKSEDNFYDSTIDLGNSGAVEPLAGRFTSHLIPVQQGEKYSIAYLEKYAFFDSSGAYLSGGSTSGVTITAPNNATHMRLSWVSDYESYITKQMVSNTLEVRSYELYLAKVAASELVLGESSYSNKSISTEKCSFLTTGKNLVNPKLAISGFIGSNGIFRESGEYKVTDFIEVKENTRYYISRNGAPATARFVVAYDENKIVVGNEGSDSSVSQLLTPTSGVKYYRLSYDASSEAGYQFEEGGVTNFESFYYELPSSEIKVPIIISKDSITKNQARFLQTKNLYDVNAITLNSFMGSSGVLVSGNSSYSVSDYIEVSPSTTYHCTSPNYNMRFYAAFDENKNVVPSEGSDVESATLTVPASGVKYYRVTVNTNERAFYQFEEGTEATNFEPFGVYRLDEDILVTATDYDYSRWSGTQFVSYGDSITAQSEWQPFVASALNLNSDVYGVGGRKVSGVDGMCQDSQLSVLPATIELLIFLGGTNDWAQSVPLGAVDSVDTNTFYGAYNVMIEKLFTSYPTAKMLFMTTPYGELPQRLTDGSNWPDAATNNEGLTTRDYAEAVRVMSKRWGFSIVDLDNLGWNTFNIADFTKDDGGLIHPDSVGGARLAEVVIGKLRSQAPL